ncbi:MAG: hypothetical protein PWP57_466 [Candidatus Atribacteria bacterium]|nr:hypothetical protein [Candidatus Atribacteria bacterium]
MEELEKRDLHTVINITGGEPIILGEELFSLLGYLNSHSRVEELMIITNGLLLEKDILFRLGEYQKLTTLKISLEGAHSLTNDAVRGRGVFDKVVDKIRLAEEISSLEVVLMFTLSKKNVKEFSSMLALSRDLGVEGVMIERFIPQGRGKEMEEAVLSREEWRDFIEELIEVCELECTPYDLLPYRAFWIKREGEIEVSGALCNLGEALCLMPEGTIFPCRRFPYPLGNILEDGLEKALDSPFLTTLKDRKHLKGRCSHCQVESCYGCRALSYALFADPYCEDVQCFWEGITP